MVQNCCGSTSVQKDPQFAHHTGGWVTGGRCRWCDMLQMLLLLPRCPVIRVTGSMRYTKYFYRSTLFSGRICYGPVSVCLFVTSRSPAYNSPLQSHARICAHSRWRCLTVLPFALQKWLDRSTAKPQTDSDTRYVFVYLCLSYACDVHVLGDTWLLLLYPRILKREDSCVILHINTVFQISCWMLISVSAFWIIL